MALIFDTSLDINGKPVKPVEVDQSFNPTSTNAQSGVAVKEAVDQAVEGVYKPAGSLLFANLPTPSADILGFVYNITDAFTTDARFVEGAGTECAAGTNVAVVNTGTSQSPVYKFDIFASGATQIQSDWAQTDTSAVDYIKNKPTIQTVTAGTGIDITNNAISVTSPTLTNTAENNTSLSINGISSSNTIDQSINIGSGSECLYNRSIAIGYNAKANPGRDNQGSVAIGRNAQANGPLSICIGNLARTTGTGTIVLGDRGLTIPSADYKFYVGNHSPDLWELLDLTTGKIPAERLPSTAPSIDNTTITKNASDQLQASAVMNARTGTDVLPIWQGTEQEWTNGKGTDWYNWRTDVTASLNNYSDPRGYNWCDIAYGNNKFIAVGNGDSATSYLIVSTDGQTWTANDVLWSKQWRGIASDGTVFVVVTSSDNTVNYTDISGTWRSSTMPSSSNWRSVAYGNGKFVAIKCADNGISGIYAYSSDGGVTWTEGTLPYSNQGLSRIRWCNDRFIIICSSENNPSSRYFYSTDGVNWLTGNFSTSTYWKDVAYGDGKYLAIADSSGRYAVSTDGINWTEGTVVSGTTHFYSIAYCNGYFVACQSNTKDKYYTPASSISWTKLESGYSARCIAANENFFAIPSYGWGYVSKLQLSQSQCYTLETEPTTASTVYSEPNTPSALTITNVGTGTITLSDNNTYTYTQSGDVTTYQTIGDAYPNYLANINGVGVKIGNTLIADNTDTSGLQTKSNLVTSVSSSSTDTQYPSAKLLYDTVGNIEATLDAIIAQGSNS